MKEAVRGARRLAPERKALWIKGYFRNKEELIKVVKSQASQMFKIRGKIEVVDIGTFKPDLEGQSVTVEFGCE